MRRITVNEYGAWQNIEEHAVRCGVRPTELQELLRRCAIRIARLLRLRDCFEFDGVGFRPVKVAGMINLGRGLELEVAPKFLASDDLGWRQDFFAIATLARFGRVLPLEALHAAPNGRDDLADLLGLAMVDMYERNRSRPLWTYQKRSWQAFEIDGDVEPESVVVPEIDGFEQEGMVLDRKNRYNQLIYHAMDVLSPEVKNGELRRRLTAAKFHLSPQLTGLRGVQEKGRLPSRHRKWQDLYDLSLSVVAGTGIGLGNVGGVLAPGYVIKTADAWESLLYRAVRVGLPDCSATKVQRPLGMSRRFRFEGAGQTTEENSFQEAVLVNPDILIESPVASPLLVDAKYRTSTARTLDRLRVESGDLYEMLAFLEAANSTRGVLIYPLPDVNANRRTGQTHIFERLEISGRLIFGLAVDVRGISSRNGFEQFASGLCEGLRICWFE